MTLAEWRPALGVAAALAVGVTVRLGFGSYGAANFDGDEATLDLIARHALSGEFPAYFYGQGYLGTLEAFLGAPFLLLDSGNPVLPRLGTLLWFVALLICHAAAVRRAWRVDGDGRAVAGDGWPAGVVAAFLVALPPWLVLPLTFRLMGYVAPLALGTAALLATRPWLIGLLLGLAVWCHPLALVFVVARGWSSFLGSDAWSATHRRLDRAAAALPVMSAALAVLVPLAAFSSGCQPAATFAPLGAAARWSILLVVAALAAFVVTSPPSRSLLASLRTASAGFVVGVAPVWMAWLVAGQPPSVPAQPSCVVTALARLPDLSGRILPLVIGLPDVAALPQMSPGQLALWLPTWLVTLAALALGLHTARRPLVALVAWRPLADRERMPAAYLLLLALPPLLVALSGIEIDHLSGGRYLMIAWLAYTGFLSLLAVRLWRSAPVLALLLGAIWLWQVPVGSLRGYAEAWHGRDPAAPHRSVQTLADFLETRGLDAGYADFWDSATIDFLARERLAITPYDDVPRYLPYWQRARAAPVTAFLMGPGKVQGTGLADLAAAIAADNGSAAVFAPLQRGTLIERAAVADWDVWLVRRP